MTTNKQGVKRYFVDCHRLHSGDKTQDECDVRVVLASDYEALQAECEKLRNLLAETVEDRDEAEYSLGLDLVERIEDAIHGDNPCQT